MEVRGGGSGIGARSSLGCWEGSLHASTLRLAGKDSSRRGGRKDRRRTRHIPGRVNGTFKGPEVGRGRCETGRGKAWEAGPERRAGSWSLLSALILRAKAVGELERQAGLGTEA